MDNEIQLSDEIKLAIIKEELLNLIDIVKVLFTVNTTLEVHRQELTGEIPEQFKSLIESDIYKQSVPLAINASNELLNNLVVFTNNLAGIFDINFASQLPTNEQEFHNMNEAMHKDLEKKVMHEYGWETE
jgi:hypothetical protein